jgi:ABC-type branched-subunit amino acid transport system ATPase component
LTLRTVGAQVHFDGVRAVDGVDLELAGGEVLGLIGPNGAGKTTLVNALTGFQDLTSGHLWIDDGEVTAWPAHKRARLGVARTFQGVRTFMRMTVRENIELGAIGCGASRGRAAERAAELIGLASFDAWSDVEARSLPHGVAHLAGVLRALATEPRYLLLDEPAAGLDERDTDGLGAFLRTVRERRDCGILLIEHDVRFVMGICDRVQVLDHGKSIAVGTPAQVVADEQVKRAYLGAEQ